MCLDAKNLGPRSWRRRGEQMIWGHQQFCLGNLSGEPFYHSDLSTLCQVLMKQQGPGGRKPRGMTPRETAETRRFPSRSPGKRAAVLRKSRGGGGVEGWKATPATGDRAGLSGGQHLDRGWRHEKEPLTVPRSRKWLAHPSSAGCWPSAPEQVPEPP